MITTRDFFGLYPTWVIAKQVYIKNSGVWKPVKQAYIKNGGVWKQVYNYNYFGSTSQQHPYWQYALDSEFRVNDQTSGDGLASDLYYTYWSNSNLGSYGISGGTARINVDIETTYHPEVTTPGYYEYTNETRSIFCNFTNGSLIVQTFNSNDLNPYTVTGADGNTYRWDIAAFGYTQGGTQIAYQWSGTEFVITKTAKADGTGIVPSISRTYPSNYVPPVTVPEYWTHSGYTRMISNYELYVQPGQTYRISSDPTTTGTLGSTTGTGWGMNAYTSGTSGQAVPFGTGSTPFESTTWTDRTARTFDVTIPSGHFYLRVGIFMSHNSTTSTNSPPADPQYNRFDYLRVTRIS